MFWHIFLESLAMIILVLLIGAVVHWLVQRKSDRKHRDA